MHNIDIPKEVLKKYFGYDAFRPPQAEIIASILAGNDTLAILPTGGGKSLCYQIPGLILPGLTLVVSPLISLMKDQVDTLQKKGIKSCYLSSSLSSQEMEANFKRLENGEFHFCYLAPERLQQTKFLDLSKKLQISFIAIDESHCISEWGHDFRPEYLKIANFVNTLAQRPKLAAFTATATENTRQEIIEQLQLNRPSVFIKSFYRENLSLKIISCKSNLGKELALLQLLKKHEGQAGIIYSSSRKTCEELTALINHFFGKNTVVTYHAGLSSEERSHIQEDYLANKIQLITATNAFGMGVDKANVRFVVHYQIPGSIENYYQEAGRAGRDGKESDCYVLYFPKDLNIQAGFIKSGVENRQKFLFWKLKQLVNLFQKKQCRMQFIADYFGENTSQACQRCDICSNWQLTKIPHSCASRKIEQMLKNKKISWKEVLSYQSLQLIKLFDPKSKSDWLKIPGIGKQWIKEWYADIDVHH